VSERIPVPAEIASQALFESDRTCCVCQVPGKPVQIHHIDSDPSNNSPENLAVSCLHCHNDTQVRGGFDRKLSPDVVRRYRIEWLDRIRKRKEAADRLVVDAMSSKAPTGAESKQSRQPSQIPSRVGFREFVEALPALRRMAYDNARAGWDSGVTSEAMKSSYYVVDVFMVALITLGRFYPEDHFDGEDPKEYFSELISQRFRWHRYHHSTSGNGLSGTIVGPLAVSDVIADVEEMIEDMVFSLSLDVDAGTDRGFQEWRKKWRQPLQ